MRVMMGCEASSMAIPLALMSIAAPIGAFDVLYYHIWRFRLYERPSSRAETVTHLVRGFVFAAIAWLIANYRLSGTWFWLAAGLLSVDFANSAVDVALERGSRAALGGVPRMEHVLHVFGATFAGAFTGLFFLLGWPERLEPTALTWTQDALPHWLVWQGRLNALGAALLTSVELALFLRSLRRSG
jgi:hypothetical protein